MNARDDSFVDHVLEQMAGFAPVRAKRMFGGAGIFRGELMFALIVDEQLYFRADAVLAAECRERGLPPFSYLARGKTVALSYFSAPPEVFDEPEAMVEWARRAYACALQAPAKRGSKKHGK
jgi:DNA transformation protein